MSVRIVQAFELLRVEPYEFLVENWPSGANSALYVSQSDATLFCPDGSVIEDEEMWPVHGYENDYVGWHMWEHADEEHEFLKYKHLMLNDGPWIFFAHIDGQFDRAVQLAREIVFRAEVWVGYVE